MAHIDYYLGTFSPYCYLAGDQLEQIAQRHGATITYKPLDLWQLFDRTGGTRPAARHQNRLDYRAQDLPRLAEHLGLAFNLKPAFMPVNGAPSWRSTAARVIWSRSGADVPTCRPRRRVNPPSKITTPKVDVGRPRGAGEVSGASWGPPTKARSLAMIWSSTLLMSSPRRGSWA